MYLYHLSENRIDNKSLTPRIPDNFLVKNGFEDDYTKRICFSRSVSGCLKAMSCNLKGKELYVYSVIIDDKDLKIPSISEVPDCKITGEIWCLKSVKLEEPCGKIKVIDADKSYKYTYGKDKQAELWSWKFKWLIKGQKYFTENLIIKYPF